MKQNQKGFTHWVILLVVVGVIAFAALAVYKNQTKPGHKTTYSNAVKGGPAVYVDKTAAYYQTSWAPGNNGGAWQPFKTPPACPAQPMLQAPVDLSSISSVLYPGQYRGEYKPHGGFRFDNSPNNNITVRAAMDGVLVEGSRYIADGEVQYLLRFMNPCGIMILYGHQHTLVPALQRVINSDLPPAKPNDSTTTLFHTVYKVKAGDVISTAVGFSNPLNAAMDFGVFDFRQPNQASKDPAYQKAHANDKEFAWHGVCWLHGWLPQSDENTLNALPGADEKNGKTSDYC